MVTYRSILARRTVVKSEIENLLQDLENASAALLPGNVPNQGIVDRHLLQSVDIELTRKFGRWYGSAISYTGPFGGYYVIDGSVLACTATLAQAGNGNQSGKPVLQVCAYLYVADASFDLLWSRAAIGYSTDGGTTWAVASSTTRPLDVANGATPRVYDSVPQENYWTGGGGYYPMNAAKDKCMILVASFGGGISEADPRDITHYGVMVNANTDANLGHGTIFLTTRDTGV